MDDVTELKLRLERDDYEIDPALVAEALLQRIGLLPERAEDRADRVSRPRARDRRGPAPDGPPRRAA